MDPTTLAPLGEVVIIALTLWGLVLFILRPLLLAYIAAQKEKVDAQRQLAEAQRKSAETNVKLLEYLEKNDAIVERNTAAMVEAKAAQTANTDALMSLVKSLPDTVAQIVRATESAATRTISEVNANTDRHDAEYRAALQEVKQVIADLRAEIAEGHKSLRGDVLGKLDKVLTLLTPPPSEPKLTLMGNERKDAA